MRIGFSASFRIHDRSRGEPFRRRIDNESRRITVRYQRVSPRIRRLIVQGFGPARAAVLAFIFTILFVALTEFRVTSQSVEVGRLRPELVIQTAHSGSADTFGHSSTVNSLVFSPDGKVLASSGQDNTITLWHVASGRKLRSLRISNRSFSFSDVTVGAFSIDGKIIASLHGDNIVRLWSVETGQIQQTLVGRAGPIDAVVFLSDGKSLVAWNDDSTGTIWDLAKGAEIRSLKGYDIYSVFSPDERRLASWGNGSISLWDAASGNRVDTIERVGNLISSLIFSPDGKFLAWMDSYDFSFHLWNINKRMQVKMWQAQQDTKAVRGIIFSPDAKTLISLNFEDPDISSKVRFWSVETGQETRTISGKIGPGICISPDGKLFATGSLEGNITLWNVASGSQLRSLGEKTNAVRSVTFQGSDDIVSWHEDETLRFWASAASIDLGAYGGTEIPVVPIISESDEKRMEAINQEVVRFWTSKYGIELRAIWQLSSPDPSVAFSPDSKTIAQGGYENSVGIWDLSSGRKLQTFLGHKGGVDSVAFSPDGKMLASGSLDNTVKLWDIVSRKLVKSLEGHVNGLRVVRFLNDGRTLASCSSDGTVKLWDIASGKDVKTLDSDTGPVLSIAISSDGALLASGEYEGAIRLWDVATGRELRALSGHFHSVTEVVFSPNGELLLSGSDDGTVRLWEVETGNELATMISIGKNEWVVTTPDGRFDTNKPLDNIEGLHWVMPDDPMTPRPLELFMRQYYEPGLLPRLLKCSKEKEVDGTDTCDKEFKPLPPISTINRVQPVVGKPAASTRTGKVR